VSARVRLIIGITGMPGAGKTTAATAVQELGFELVNMGDMVRRETARRGLPLTDEYVGRVMRELRAQGGPGAVAQLCADAIRSARQGLVVVDGVRSMSEVAVFKSLGPFKLLSVHASPHRRFSLLTSRGRADAPRSWEEFQDRDSRELSVGLGEAIALADEVVSNNRGGPEDLKRQVRDIVAGWMKEVEG
jgi:dephospho-CoA kinase